MLLQSHTHVGGRVLRAEEGDGVGEQRPTVGGGCSITIFVEMRHCSDDVAMQCVDSSVNDLICFGEISVYRHYSVSCT